ncbi:ABC transporter ATP-binding protein [uncultured Eubacterium sp.]|uniref:ABC transporter ATP-binding protein n=1 Tax=uncultured Eubacterium sp. TaxID=165185 RepID=UPI0026722D9B|nr:ABC transporter ATP-binding protein [uncultured Eubacterium sp.]
MSVIEIENLVKKYGDNVAVDNLNLKIEKGKVYGFLGPNGAGKSTTMNIITGYIGSTSGTVKINGYDIFREPERAKKCVGYLPEIPPLYQDMTVREYLAFVTELKKIPKREREKNISDVLDMTKTTQVEKRLIRNLSKGYKQRIGIAQALIGMPEVIILDEPTVGLDPKQIIEIRQLIKELGRYHTVILSSHILSEISEVCDYIYIISRGKLVAAGSEKELVEQLAGENVLELEMKGDKSEAVSIMESFSEIESYKIMEAENNQCVRIKVVCDGKRDIRDKIFYMCAERKMPILEMHFKQKTLEDIFIELTKEYAPPEKKKRAVFRKKREQKVITEEDIYEEVEALKNISEQEEIN